MNCVLPQRWELSDRFKCYSTLHSIAERAHLVVGLLFNVGVIQISVVQFQVEEIISTIKDDTKCRAKYENIGAKSVLMDFYNFLYGALGTQFLYSFNDAYRFSENGMFKC